MICKRLVRVSKYLLSLFWGSGNVQRFKKGLRRTIVVFILNRYRCIFAPRSISESLSAITLYHYLIQCFSLILSLFNSISFIISFQSIIISSSSSFYIPFGLFIASSLFLYLSVCRPLVLCFSFHCLLYCRFSLLSF